MSVPNFPLGTMIGMVRLRTSYILSSKSWEIDSPLTDGARTFVSFKTFEVTVIILNISFFIKRFVQISLSDTQ